MFIINAKPLTVNSEQLSAIYLSLGLSPPPTNGAMRWWEISTCHQRSV
ncbi:MAG: hypothetical protein V7L20_30255 [Nostoc sp.]